MGSPWTVRKACMDSPWGVRGQSWTFHAVPMGWCAQTIRGIPVENSGGVHEQSVGRLWTVRGQSAGGSGTVGGAIEDTTWTIRRM